MPAAERSTIPALDRPMPAAIAVTLAVAVDRLPPPASRCWTAACSRTCRTSCGARASPAGRRCSAFYRDPEVGAGRLLRWWRCRRSGSGRMSNRLAAERPCAVFWSCAEGEPALWRHLRMINQVLIPAEDASEGRRGTQPERAAVPAPGPERAGERAAAAGPGPVRPRARPGPGGGDACAGLWRDPLEVPRPPDLPAPVPRPAPAGPGADERAAEAVMVQASRLRIARFLKEPDAARCRAGSPTRSCGGRPSPARGPRPELGIREKQGRARWAYVMVLSGGKAATLPEVRGFVGNGEATPDQQVKALIRHTADALRRL